MPNFRVWSCLLLAIIGTHALGQIKRTVTPDDAKVWENLSQPQISSDGKWISYELNRLETDGALVIKASDGPVLATIPNAGRAEFTDDAKWIAFLVSPPRSVIEKLRKDHKPIETKLVLKNLGNGAETTFDSVEGYDFLKGNRFLMARKLRGASKSEGGSDLFIFDLTDGTQLTIGNVVSAHPNHEENLVAIRTESDSGEKGVQVINPATHVLTPVYWGKGKVNQLEWAKAKDLLTFLVEIPDEAHEIAGNRVFLCSDVNSGHPKLKVFSPDAYAIFPKDKRISDAVPLRLNDDGSAISFGIQAWRNRKEPAKGEEKASVQVWNAQDLRVIPRQIATANADLNKCSVCVWQTVEDTFREIGDGHYQTVGLLPGFRYAILNDPIPYQKPANNGIEYWDRWLVDTKSGERTRIVTKNQFPTSFSRTGRYVTFFERRGWQVLDTKDLSRHEVTANLKVPFDDVEDDHTIQEKPPVRPPFWFKDDGALLLGDRYDAWLVDPANWQSTKLTEGRKDHVSFHFTDLDTNNAEDGPSIDSPLFFEIFDEDTKATGVFKTDRHGHGKLLARLDSQIDEITKSKSTDRVLFRMQTFEQSPNLYLTNLEFSAIKPESKANAQQSLFTWGKAEIVSYKSRFGKELKGVLVYPANFLKGQTYPMVTHVYERQSDELHQYVPPVDWDPYNTQLLSQSGYFVFLPDITYQPRNPGKSAVDCLEPALNAVFTLNVGVDPKKVGLIGHSWGGYETAFVTTVSKAFAVGVAGAPLTELTSMYNSFYWNTGSSQQPLFESQQARMEVPFWEDPKAYLENSPVWQSEKRTVPILLEEGDQDGAVPWQQSQYLYQTLRRQGKNCVFLVYPGENHGLSRRPNQLDYAHRLRHFLDVYLRGAKPEPWVTEGVPYIKQ